MRRTARCSTRPSSSFAAAAAAEATPAGAAHDARRCHRPPLPATVDAVVCGGGPAGATFAALLVRQGLTVAVFERERFPRFHIGESLLPWNMPLLERLGVLPELTRNMQTKLGARFYHHGTERSRIVRFVDGMDDRHPSAFQVKRADFDRILLDNARRSGAAVFEEARVEEVLFDATGRRATGVRVKLAGEATPREVAARVVVDATGRDALLSRKVGGRMRDPLLNRSAAFAHFDTFRRDDGPTGGDIIVVTTPDGWWWMIPFSDGSVSVGVVMPSQRFKTRPGPWKRCSRRRWPRRRRCATASRGRNAPPR